MCNKIPHKHAELIKAWADGATIEYSDGAGWRLCDSPLWLSPSIYRIKPEPKPDIVRTRHVALAPVNSSGIYFPLNMVDNVEFTFDGETMMLKSVRIVE